MIQQIRDAIAHRKSANERKALRGEMRRLARKHVQQVTRNEAQMVPLEDEWRDLHARILGMPQ